jgi:hypothetical protein
VTSAGGTTRRVLLDECVPRLLLRELPGLNASHTTTEKWAGRRNGDLLRLMKAGGFAVLITMDRNLRFQQNVAASGIAVIVLHARSNRVPDLIPLIPALRAALTVAEAGTVANVGG